MSPTERASNDALDLPLPVATVDERGVVVAANDLLADALGLSIDELRGRAFVEIAVMPSDREAVASALERCGDRPTRACGTLASGARAPTVWHLRRRGGRTVIVGTPAHAHDAAAPGQEEDGKEGRFEGLVTQSPVGVFETDGEGRCLFVNRRWRSITGIDEVDARGHTWLAFLEPSERREALEDWTRGAMTLASYRRELRSRREDGLAMWVLAQTVPKRDERGRVVGHVGTLTDVTEGRLAQEVLHRERTRLRSLVQAFPGFVAVYALDGTLVDANRASLEQSDRRQGDGLGTHPLLTRTEPLRRTFEDVWRRAQAGETVGFEFTTTARDGQRLELDASLTPIRDVEGHITNIAAFATDVSERKRTLARLSEAQRLAALGSWDHDYRTGTTSWSDELYRLLDLAPRAAPPTFATYLAAVHPDDRAACAEMHERLPECRAPFSVTRRIVHGNGIVRHVHEHYDPTFDAQGQVVRMSGTVQDVTAQVQAENELRTHSQVLMSMGEGVLFIDERAAIRACNPAFERMFGYAPGELVGRSVSDLNEATADENVEISRAIRREIDEKGSFHGVLRNRKKDGTSFLTCAHITPLERGGETFWVSIQEDVTERVQAARELERMNHLLTSVLEATPDFIFVKDVNHRFLMTNRAFATMLGKEPQALVGVADDAFWPPAVIDDEGETIGLHTEDRRVLEGELVHDRRRVLDMPDGTHRVMDVIKAPLRDPAGRVYGVLGFCRDVTERQALIDTQQRLLAEKEILLREIHHRVKNNLQIISGLLHFQAKKARDPFDVAAFSEARGRLLAMTIIHDKLYQSNDYSRIELGDYVRSLVGTLTQFATMGRVAVRVDANAVRLPMEVALSCGMILSELVTNAFKYAFPDGRAGSVTVSVLRDGDEVTLSVRDDGVGFPDGFDPQHVSSFGWQLVRNLADRLEGSLTVEAASGAHVRITFGCHAASPPS